MVEKYVFTGVDFQDPTLPTNRGNNGVCFARADEQMNSCCYLAANRLILLDQISLVFEATESLKGNTLSSKSRLKGLNGALNKYT